DRGLAAAPLCVGDGVDLRHILRPPYGETMGWRNSAGGSNGCRETRAESKIRTRSAQRIETGAFEGTRSKEQETLSCLEFLTRSGAGDGDRTRDLQLGKLALSR